MQDTIHTLRRPDLRPSSKESHDSRAEKHTGHRIRDLAIGRLRHFLVKQKLVGE